MNFLPKLKAKISVVNQKTQTSKLSFVCMHWREKGKPERVNISCSLWDTQHIKYCGRDANSFQRTYWTDAWHYYYLLFIRHVFIHRTPINSGWGTCWFGNQESETVPPTGSIILFICAIVFYILPCRGGIIKATWKCKVPFTTQPADSEATNPSLAG